MRRDQLEHVIRASAAITKEDEFVVLGSQAVLAQYPAPPSELILSNEVDLYPRNRPELADLIDGSIGVDSSFHELFGYYADGVGPETAVFPEDWQDRAVHLRNENTGGATAICPEIHDLAISKLCAGREKDVSWVEAAASAHLIERDRLLRLLAKTKIQPELRALLEKRITHLSFKA